ncbi:MAG: aminotransferase class I/II-fold pyridoxal phosphate-dependent enzyme, partial [Stellaceae bacterium]
HYADHYGVEIAPERVVVTAGSSAALLLVLALIVNRDERILLADPGYPCSRHFVRVLEGAPTVIPVGPETRYQLTADMVERHWTSDTRGVLVATPSNPTGTTVPRDEMRRIERVVERLGGRLIVDEIYLGLTYGEPPHSALGLTDEAFVISSFSKYFSMTGWRLGWMLVPPDLRRSVECLAQNFYISPPALSQLAAVPAFGCRVELDAHVARYRANRDTLARALSVAGLTRFAPAEGAFYLYVDISELTGDSEAWCRRLLAETDVAITPGLDFDPLGGGGWVRISFAGATLDIAEAARRLTAWLPRRGDIGGR